MSSIDSPHTPRSRSRRRLAAWIAFGVAGLATGAVWATGFGTIGGAMGSETDPVHIDPTNPVDHTANLNGTVAPGTALTYNWNGRWGAVVDTNLFTVDLRAEDPANTYNIGFLLSNGPLLSAGGGGTGWSTIQLKLEVVEASGGGGTTCAAADFDGAQAPEVMAFDADDAGVYFNGLAGDKVWCVGINTSDGQDTAGTFIRRATDGVDPTVFPQFIATVDRAS